LEPDRNEKGDITVSTSTKAREIIMKSSLTAEQKTLIDAGLLRSTYTDEEDNEHQWTADYSDKTMFELSQMGRAAYERAKENISGGMTPADALMVEKYRVEHKYEPIKNEAGETIKTSTEQFRAELFKNTMLNPEQKTMLDKAIIGNDYTPDYSNAKLFGLSSGAYERVQKNIKAGYSESDSLLIESHYSSFSESYEEGRRKLFKSHLSAEQKAMVDKALTGKVADYSSAEMFELSLMGTAYDRAKKYMAADARITPSQALKIEQYHKKNNTKEEMVNFLFKVMGYGKNRVNIILEAYGWKPI